MKHFFLLFSQIIFIAIAVDPEYPAMGSVVIGTNQVCPQYLCKTSTIKNGCATYSNEDIIMERCFDDWYCDWSESSSRNYQYGKCILKRKHYKFRKNIGEFCYQNEDCKSFYCASNKCSVLQENKICQNHYQCDKGLLCDPITNICTKWLANGASCSSNPSMCNPQSGCVQVDGSLAVCTKYFSLTTNAYSIMSMGQYGSAGSSFFCESASRATNEQRCLTTALTLSGGYPLVCTSNTDCAATGETSRYSECNCWPNTVGVKYCYPFPGDIPEVIKRAKEKVKQDFSKCYNFEIAANLNGCGYFSEYEYRDWAPQIKAKTWGSCYDAVNMSIGTYVAMSYTGSTYGACPAIKCLEKGNNADGYCFAYYKESFLYYVQSCPRDYLCGNKQNGDYSLTSSSVLCKEVRPKHQRHKDEACWVNNDCFSGMCGINKYCTVYTEGSSCTSDNQCDRALICRPSSLASASYTCQKWLKIGERCTTNTYYLCRPGSLCISSSSSDEGTCQGHYSVAGGSSYYQITSVGGAKGTSSQMCRSGAMDPTTQSCFSTPSKLAEFPLKCNLDTECKSTNYNQQSMTISDGHCTCIPNTQGYKYCSVFPANIDSDFFEWMYNYFKRDLTSCFSYEIGQAFGGSCELGIRYHDIWQRSIPSEYFPSCGKDILYDEPRYQHSQEEDLIFLYVYSARLFIGFIMLAWILLFV